MINNDDKTAYETDNLGLAAYMALNGLEYTGTRLGVGKNEKLKVYFQFNDITGASSVLEKDFLISNEKRFRDFLFFFRGEVDKGMEQDNGVVTQNIRPSKYGRSR